MEYIKNISIEPIDNSKAVKVGFLLIAGIFTARIFLEIDYALNPLSRQGDAFVGLNLILFGIITILRFVIASWAGKIAAGLNRGVVFWTIFSFIFPPIGLISLGFMDTKIEDEEVKKVVDECRADYLAEQIQIKREIAMTDDEEVSLLADLKVKYEKELQERLIDFQAETKIQEIHNLEDEGIINDKVDYNEQKQKIKDSIRQNIELKTETNSDLTEANIDNNDNCPACGFRINEELIICPDCGLTLR